MGTIFDSGAGLCYRPWSRAQPSEPVQRGRIYQPSGECLIVCLAVVLALD